MHVCMYACMYVCMYVCMYSCLAAFMYVFMPGSMVVALSAFSADCMHVCIFVCVCMVGRTPVLLPECVSMYVCVVYVVTTVCV